MTSTAGKNLLLLSIDDLNAFATLKSLYPGYIDTPNIDRLMAQGTIFSNAIAQVALCNPSRVSALTGQMPSSTGVFDNSQTWYEAVDPADTIFANLRDAGFYTAGGGKLLHSPSMPSDIQAQIFDTYFAPSTGYNVNDVEDTFEVHPYAGSDEDLADVKVVNWAEDFLSSYDSPQPFFLSVGIFRPHASWIVPQEFFDLYSPDQVALPYHLPNDLADIPEFVKSRIDHGLQQVLRPREPGATISRVTSPVLASLTRW